MRPITDYKTIDELAKALADSQRLWKIMDNISPREIAGYTNSLRRARIEAMERVKARVEIIAAKIDEMKGSTTE